MVNGSGLHLPPGAGGEGRGPGKNRIAQANQVTRMDAKQLLKFLAGQHGEITSTINQLGGALFAAQNAITKLQEEADNEMEGKVESLLSNVKTVKEDLKAMARRTEAIERHLGITVDQSAAKEATDGTLSEPASQGALKEK